MQKRKILLVDDEKDFAEFLRLNLSITGKYDVRAVNDGTQAMAFARQFHPDVILLDEIMPGMDGAAVAADLQKDPALKNTPIIFLTAAITEQETRTHAGIIGEHVFIAKPASVEKIMERIDSILSR